MMRIYMFLSRGAIEYAGKSLKLAHRLAGQHRLQDSWQARVCWEQLNWLQPALNRAVKSPVVEFKTLRREVKELRSLAKST